MTVRMRLQRKGARKRPYYRVVVADQRSPRDGRFIELLGTYDPLQKPPVIRLKSKRIDYWLDVGAQPSKTVNHLISQLDVEGAVVDLDAEGADDADKAARAAKRKEEVEGVRQKAKAEAEAEAEAKEEAEKKAEEAKKAKKAEAEAAEKAAEGDDDDESSTEDSEDAAADSEDAAEEQ